MTNNYLQAAFDQVCANAKKAEGFYVALMERRPFYGGPEEGGWWGNDTIIVAYQHCSTEEEAEAKKAQVETFAIELSQQSKRDFGVQCLKEMDWLEARGLDSDFLPEPDGESDYFVIVSKGLPQETYGCRHYE